MTSEIATATVATDSTRASHEDKPLTYEDRITDAIKREDKKALIHNIDVHERETALAMRRASREYVRYVSPCRPGMVIALCKAVELGSAWGVETILNVSSGKYFLHIGLFHACRLNNAQITSLIAKRVKNEHERNFILPLALALARKCGSEVIASEIEGLGYEVPQFYSLRAFSIAVDSGCVELVELTHSPGYEIDLDEEVIAAAKGMGSTEVLAWLERHGVSIA